MSATINLDIAKRVDIVCRKGDTFAMSISITDSFGEPIDVSSDYSFEMEVRPSDFHGNDGLDSATISVSSASEITVNPENTNSVSITIPASTMENVESGLYVYDFQSVMGGVVTTWLYGTFKINEDVTI